MSAAGATKKSKSNLNRNAVVVVDYDITNRIEMALTANIEAQSEFLASLSRIAAAKRKLALAMHCGLDQHDCKLKIVSADANNECNEESGRSSKRRKTARNIPTTKKAVKGWEMNENRRWMRRFFLDPNLSIPRANAETFHRRKWEGTLIGLHKARYTPWTKNDVELLTKCIEEVKKEQGFYSGNKESILVNDGDIDFQNVYKKIKEELTKKKLNPVQLKKNQNMSYSSNDCEPQNGTIRLRRWTDYRNKYLYSISPFIKKSPFSKQESERLREIVLEFNRDVQWSEIPIKLDNTRTVFQCFKQIQMNLTPSNGKLDATEDELLLKCVAASGPQFVINHHTATSLSQRFFPHLSTRQICVRLNSLLVNPNYKNEKWTDFEERILVLGMKAFSENLNPLTKVAVSTLQCDIQICVFLFRTVVLH